MDFNAESTFLPEALRAEGPDGTFKRTHAWEAYYADLRRFVARQLRGQQDPDDVVQDIYQELYISRFGEALNPRAWIWKIAWRVVHQAFQREKSLRDHFVAAAPEDFATMQSDHLGSAPSQLVT